MTSTLEAGLETERCMFYRVPADGLVVNRQEIRYTPGSHHVLLFKTPYTEFPTTTIGGKTIDTQRRVRLRRKRRHRRLGGPGRRGRRAVRRTAHPASTACPATPRSRSTGNSLLLVNAHYLNASDKPLDAEIYINLHTDPGRAGDA